MPRQLHVDYVRGEQGHAKEMLVPEKFKSVSGEDWCKPLSGGLWTSTLIEPVWSDWCWWTSGEEFMYKERCDAFILDIDPKAKIFEINSASDVRWLTRLYPSMKYDTGFLRMNWTALSEDFHGVHLTETGNSLLHSCGDISVSMNPWDSESTVWLKWAFTKVEKTNISNPDEVRRTEMS